MYFAIVIFAVYLLINSGFLYSGARNYVSFADREMQKICMQEFNYSFSYLNNQQNEIECYKIIDNMTFFKTIGFKAEK